ncbi:hypothetical protein SAMN05216223_1252 [Actinacidiphila yanglinensis]|uniref:WXG100 family type VII secretion target n=1 Tax=Actinacidiphila yanglinensis TaxID=310779 RepID=A0A1H6E4Q2_9ACTN|nr:hypothetical protein [Actinacidiphila yanglinensis]SEG91994.1 hypothetical protein SAMN05216223_1252 [Actinacidiphila yanglinensis]
MPVNADYDVSTLRVRPQDLSTASDRLVSLAEQMADEIEGINDAVSSLVLSWVGNSAGEAQEFNNSWKNVMLQLFGKKDGPTGVLPAMAGGLLGTAVAYSHTEVELASAFQKFSSGLADTGGAGDTPSDHTGPDYPLSQDYPN